MMKDAILSDDIELDVESVSDLVLNVHFKSGEPFRGKLPAAQAKVMWSMLIGHV